MIKTDAACDRKEKVVEEKREIREVSLETDNANQCEAEVKFSET